MLRWENTQSQWGAEGRLIFTSLPLYVRAAFKHKAYFDYVRKGLLIQPERRHLLARVHVNAPRSTEQKTHFAHSNCNFCILPLFWKKWLAGLNWPPSDFLLDRSLSKHRAHKRFTHINSFRISRTELKRLTFDPLASEVLSRLLSWDEAATDSPPARLLKACKLLSGRNVVSGVPFGVRKRLDRSVPSVRFHTLEASH